MAVYLLHFDRPLAHARHYVGYADDDKLHQRIDKHYDGTSKSKLMEALKRAGIGFTLARVWPNADRHFERRQKQHGHAAKCPICKPNMRIRKGVR